MSLKTESGNGKAYGNLYPGFCVKTPSIPMPHIIRATIWTIWVGPEF